MVAENLSRRGDFSRSPVWSVLTSNFGNNNFNFREKENAEIKPSEPVFVPNTYFETSAGSFTTTSSVPSGFDVQTPPCFTQNVHVQARAGISTGSGSHASVKAMLPQ